MSNYYRDEYGWWRAVHPSDRIAVTGPNDDSPSVGQPCYGLRVYDPRDCVRCEFGRAHSLDYHNAEIEKRRYRRTHPPKYV
jgi:hypothetical protein